jgi:hypothetical protein
MKTQSFIEMLQKDIELNAWMADAEIGVNNGGEVTGIGLGGEYPISIIHEYYPEHSEKSKWETFEAMFKQAGLAIEKHREITNGYFPRCYTKSVAENPWWLVKTPWGFIEIGWRKRVISIDWSGTPLRMIITQDDVTKSETMVHAWTEEKCVEYLTELRRRF